MSRRVSSKTSVNTKNPTSIFRSAVTASLEHSLLQSFQQFITGTAGSNLSWNIAWLSMIVSTTSKYCTNICAIRAFPLTPSGIIPPEGELSLSLQVKRISSDNLRKATPKHTLTGLDCSRNQIENSNYLRMTCGDRYVPFISLRILQGFGPVPYVMLAIAA